jgi:hypothetical protein
LLTASTTPGHGQLTVQNSEGVPSCAGGKFWDGHGIGTVTKTESYRYDGLGRRIGKFVGDNGDTVIDRSETFIYDGAALLSPLPRFGGEGQGEGVFREGAGASAIRIPGVNGALGQYGWVDNAILVYSDADGSGPGTSTLTSRNLYGPLVDQIFAGTVPPM